MGAVVRSRNRILWAVVVVVVAVAAASAWNDRRQARDSPLARAEAVRDQVREAQSEADRCLELMAVSETRFRDQERETGELQERIRRLEGLHPEGVPADSYEVYLATVERFNAAIEGWETRGGILEDRQRECRALLGARNVLADSLRGLLVDMGYLPGDSAPHPGSF
jgi:hypothetical protein